MNATTKTAQDSARHEAGEDSNRSGNPSLLDILDARLSRRNVLRVGVGTAGAAVFGSLAACGGGGSDSTPISLGFTAVSKSLADTVMMVQGMDLLWTEGVDGPAVERAVVANGAVLRRPPLAGGGPVHEANEMRAGDPLRRWLPEDVTRAGQAQPPM